MSKFKSKEGYRNQLLQGDGFFVSYNPDTSAMGWPFAGDGDGEETALVKDGRYLILNGDFRAAYERLVPEGWEACKKFYDQQSAHAESSWSDAKRS